MLWWRSKEKPASQGDDSVPDRLSTLSRRVDDIESDSRKLRAEWLDTLDRVNRLAQRIAKRAERELRALDAAREAPPDSPAASLSNIAARVRARRNGHGPTGGSP